MLRVYISYTGLPTIEFRSCHYKVKYLQTFNVLDRHTQSAEMAKERAALQELLSTMTLGQLLPHPLSHMLELAPELTASEVNLPFLFFLLQAVAFCLLGTNSRFFFS